MKCTVYRITGSIPAGNYIQFPRTSTQSLSLTGRYLYILFKPISGKYFVAHIDVATEDGLAIRISFSNLFKEFKSTSTWLQFPFVPRPPPGSVDEAILASSTSHGMRLLFGIYYITSTIITIMTGIIMNATITIITITIITITTIIIIDIATIISTNCKFTLIFIRLCECSYNVGCNFLDYNCKAI